jgi:hypothetical protein
MLQNPSNGGHLPGSQADRVAALTAWILAVLATLFMAWPVWRATLPLEVWSNEGWNAYHADDAFNPGALYPSPAGLVASNYPPLWYLVTGSLARLFGDTVMVGRVLSLFAVLSLGALAGVLARQFGATRVAAALGGFWLVATMARFFDAYVGMNEPQLFAQAVMAIGLVWFIARQSAGRAVEPAVLLMVAAGFIKHNLVAYPAVALIWLALHDRRLAGRATLVGGAAAALGLALCAWLYAPHFIADLLMPRSYNLVHMLKVSGRLQWVLPALAVWAIWAWPARHTDAARFSALLIAAALVVCLVQKTGAGIDENSQFDLVFATAVGVGIAFGRWTDGRWSDGTWRGGWTPVRIASIAAAVLVLRLLASTRVEFAHVLASPDYRAEAMRNAAVMRAEAATVAAMPGPVACSNLVLCRMAGKPFVYDHFYATQLIATGRMTEAELKARLESAGIRQVVNDQRTTAPSLYRRWPSHRGS